MNNKTIDAFAKLEEGVLAALETYSNVHRGTGHYSIATTQLYEHSRDIILEYLGLNKIRYTVIFCNSSMSESIKIQLKPENYKLISSEDIGLPVGVMALAVKKKMLSGIIPSQTGGGTTRLVSPKWIIWAKGPGKFEAGTPAIINIIAVARALKMVKQYGNEIFRNPIYEMLTASEILYHDDLEKYSGKILLEQLRNSLVCSNKPVPVNDGIRTYINFDNAASTPSFLPVWKAFRQTWNQPLQVQKDIIQEVRTICAGFLNAPLDKFDLIFTSNTTEALNHIAASFSRELADGKEAVLLKTIMEHSSNDLPWRSIQNLETICLSIDEEGFPDLNELENHLASYNGKNLFGNKRIRFVAVSGASNVTGVYPNLREISLIVHKYGARLIVDAAQMIGHRNVDIEGYDIDYLCFSAHKTYAPFGTGVLFAKKGFLNYTPSGMDKIQSSGTENAAGIAVLGKALVLLKRIGMDIIQEEELALTARALKGLAQIDSLTVYGINNPESPQFIQKGGVIAFSIKGIMADKVARSLAENNGIGVRSGCHCAHLLVKHILKVSPGLAEFQRIILTIFPRLSLPGVVRISIGIGNTGEDIDTLINILKNFRQQQKFRKTDIQGRITDFLSESSQRVWSTN